MSAQGQRIRPTLFAVFVAIVLFGSGCSSDAPISSSTSATTILPAAATEATAHSTSAPPPSNESPTTTVELQPEPTFALNSNEEAVVRDFRLFLENQWKWLGDPDAPELEMYTVGAMLEQRVLDAETNLAQGEAARLPDDPATYAAVHNIEFVSATRATFEACVVDDRIVYFVESGEVKSDIAETLHYVYTSDLSDGRWKISGLTPAAEPFRWTGVGGCAVDGL